MEKKINYIVREVPAEACDFNFYFEDDGLTEAGGDYCNNLFIVPQSRNHNGFNGDEYQSILSEIEEIAEHFDDIMIEYEYAQYESIEELLGDYGLETVATDFFNWCREKPSSLYRNYYNNLEAFSAEAVAKYLTLKTGKQWDTDEATGYRQGDYVEMVYCPEHYTSGVKNYGEIWLGAGKEFSITFLDETGEEENAVYGYIVADSQARTEEDYKKIICEWEGIPEDETLLEVIDTSWTTTQYSYRTI